MKEFEEVINQIGAFGPYQIRAFVCVNLLEFWAAMAMLLPVFTGAKPDMTCSHHEELETFSYLSSNASNVTTAVCSENNTVCSGLKYSDEFTSIITEWTLLCGKSFVSDLITTVQMVGVLFGAFIAGQLADLLGRKSILYSLFALMVVTGFASAFAPSWPVYTALRFFVGGSLGGLLVVSFILPIEIVAPRWRTLCGCIGLWGLGVACLALFAFLARDWRHLTMISSAPGLLVLLTWWWVPESPRWLIMHDRYEEATKIIQQMAEFNKKKMPDLTGLQAYVQRERNNEKKTRAYSYWHLFKTWKMARVTLLAMYAWFTCTTVYYGINLNMKNLTGDRYINVFLSGILEIPALLFVGYINNKAGRRYTSSGLLLLGALAMFAILAIDLLGKLDTLSDVTVAVVMVGKSAVSAGWGAFMVFSAESFPTVARNIGYGACSVAGRIGGIVAPQLVYLNEISRPLPYIVFGSLGVICSVAVLLLPETKDAPLPETFKVEVAVTSESKHELMSGRPTNIDL